MYRLVRMVWFRSIFLVSVAAVMLSLQAADALCDSAGALAPAIREHRMQEPVFGGRVYLLEAGDKANPPLVLIHGLGDLASGTWRPLLPELAKSYHVVTFDLPGFGRSDKENSLYSPGNYAAFVKWVVDTFIGAPPIVVGHSLGGAIALRYAGTYPNMLTRLVLVDVAGILERQAYSKEMLRVFSAGFSVPFDLNNLLERLVCGLSGPLIDLDRVLETDLLRSQLLGGNPAIIASLALLQENFSPYLYRVRVPAVILWGEKDQVTPRRTGTLLEATLPKARLQIIPGAGHVPMVDSPRLFEAALSAALSEEVVPVVRATGKEIGPGRCEGRSGMIFSGDYTSIDIVDCQDVRLQEVSAESVRLVRSTATFDKGVISGRDVGLQADGSTVTANGLRVEAPVAIVANNSRLDLAGVRLIGFRSAVTTDNRVTLLFSVSRIQSPHGTGTIHGLRELVVGEAL